MRKISLDVETTGLDPNEHSILSIGMVDLETGEDFYIELDQKKCVITEEASAINKWNFEDNNMCRVSPHLAAERVDTWIRAKGMKDESIVTLGKNVDFDLEFMKKMFRTYSLESPFHYRKIDLNSLFYTIEESIGITKDLIITRAETKFTKDRPSIIKLGPHNALYDAWWNVFCYNECTYIINMKESL